MKSLFKGTILIALTLLILATPTTAFASTEVADTTKPTLNAAINSGMLTITAFDTESEIAAIVVNGYEYTDLTDGVLTIQLQLFDATYEEFEIYAVDAAGNVSATYAVDNPYYGAEDDEDLATELPVDATATEVTSATSTVTAHTVIETEDGEITKEFYTIETSSGKEFYLIIDSSGDDELVYFLTEVSENDLLNTIVSTTETLPQNSAAVTNGIDETTVSTAAEPAEEEVAEAGILVTVASDNKVVSYATYGGLALIFILIVYFVKIRKKDDYIDDEDEEEETEMAENDEAMDDDDEDLQETA